MRRFMVSTALFLLAASSLRAQQSFAYEAGVFAEYSKFSDTTHLKDGVGFGLRVGVYPFKNFELEYEADLNSTSSSRVGNLTALNNRIDGIFYFPLNDKWRLLAGRRMDRHAVPHRHDAQPVRLGRQRARRREVLHQQQLGLARGRDRGLQEPIRPDAGRSRDDDMERSLRLRPLPRRTKPQRHVHAEARATAAARSGARSAAAALRHPLRRRRPLRSWPHRAAAAATGTGAATSA